MTEADRFGDFGLRKYNSSEPRVPAGDPAGGQWAGEGSAQSRPRKSKHWPGKYHKVPGSPKDAKVVRYPDGSVVSDPKSGTRLLAPSSANFRHVYATGEAIGGEAPWRQYETARDAIAQEGEFDFQRDPSTGRFFPPYSNASNYAVGVYMSGAGYNWPETWDFGTVYALTHSSNFGSPNQMHWIERGWDDAHYGKWK